MVMMVVREGREREKGGSCEWTRSCLERCLVLVRDGQGIILVWMLLCFDDALSFLLDFLFLRRSDPMLTRVCYWDQGGNGTVTGLSRESFIHM
jgi:hypothetical protein